MKNYEEESHPYLELREILLILSQSMSEHGNVRARVRFTHDIEIVRLPDFSI